MIRRGLHEFWRQVRSCRLRRKTTCPKNGHDANEGVVYRRAVQSDELTSTPTKAGSVAVGRVYRPSPIHQSRLSSR